jgi:hypothetical protein
MPTAKTRGFGFGLDLSTRTPQGKVGLGGRWNLECSNCVARCTGHEARLGVKLLVFRGACRLVIGVTCAMHTVHVHELFISCGIDC